MTIEMNKDFNTPEEVVAAVKAMKLKNSANRMAKFFPKDYFLGLSADEQKHAARIVKAGLLNDDSEIGAYAMETSDYDNFGSILDPIIQDYHSVSDNFTFSSDWNIDEKNLDLKDVDSQLSDISMRIRVARNVEGFPLTGNMTQSEGGGR